MTLLIGLASTKEPWVWGFADVAALTVLVANVLLLSAVHLGRLRRHFRSGRQKRFRAEVEEVLAELDPKTRANDPNWLRERSGDFDELERPLMAVALIERMRPATEEERAYTLEALREARAIELIARPTRPWLPWRRALSIRTLGWIGADEKVPMLIDRLFDRNRHVRESAVRALGHIRDPRALPVLGDLFRAPGPVGPGVVYDAMVTIGGEEAERIFAGALRSPLESVRVSSCFGVAALSEATAAGTLLTPLLEDPSAAVRTAAAKALGKVGGDQMPIALARASRDEEPMVRAAATAALGSFNDPHAVEVVLNALLDADRDTAVHAGEALVRLSERTRAASVAAQAIERSADEWPIERALTLASISGLVT
jgi:HEAT repeat protein